MKLYAMKDGSLKVIVPRVVEKIKNLMKIRPNAYAMMVTIQKDNVINSVLEIGNSTIIKINLGVDVKEAGTPLTNVILIVM